MAVSRIRLRDIQFTRLPQLIGVGASDVATLAQIVNSAQERLVTCREAGDHGWYGSYAEIAFTVSQTSPTIVLPRGVARIEYLDVCNVPVPINNQFFEYLTMGDGRWPKTACSSTAVVCQTGPRQVFRRSSACTFSDLTTPGYGLRFTTTEPSDAGRRILVGCFDSFGQKVFTLDGTIQVNGVMTTFAMPFADLVLPGTTAPLELSAITGIQKDPTLGTIGIWQVNLTTGAQSLIGQMEPGETVASYSVYYFNSLPTGCCPAPGVVGAVQVNAMVKLDLVRVSVPTDYLLIQSVEAIIEEAQAIRLSGSDSQQAKTQAALHHHNAIGFLQGQLAHEEGKDGPAVVFAPFGTARLNQQQIGTLT